MPRVEPYASGANRPYVVFGREYVPDTSDRPFTEHGIASWYGRKFNGQRTASGEIYDMYSMTAAHPTHPELRAGHQSGQWPLRDRQGE